MKKIKIETDEKLFNRWKELGRKISCQAAIAQNDMEVTKQDIVNWSKDIQGLKAEFKILIRDTSRFIAKAVTNS